MIAYFILPILFYVTYRYVNLDIKYKSLIKLSIDKVNTLTNEIDIIQKRMNEYVRNHPPECKFKNIENTFSVNKTLEHFSPDQLNYKQLEQCMNYFIENYKTIKP